jgi:hypothetical protein
VAAINPDFDLVFLNDTSQLKTIRFIKFKTGSSNRDLNLLQAFATVFLARDSITSLIVKIWALV